MTATDEGHAGSDQAGVMFLHGIARTARSLRRMEQAVAAAGFATLNLDYPSRRASLAELADGLHRPIAAFAAELSGSVHVVAHSMGGLVARVYLARHRPPHLGRVVMLGTPNGGSEVADLLRDVALYRGVFGPAGQQLVTRRDAATRALLPPPDYPVGVIAGNRSLYPLASLVLPKPNDGRVSVRNTRLEGMHDHVVIATSHPQLVSHPAAIRQTIAFLRHGRFSHDGTGL